MFWLVEHRLVVFGRFETPDETTASGFESCRVGVEGDGVIEHSDGPFVDSEEEDAGVEAGPVLGANGVDGREIGWR